MTNLMKTASLAVGLVLFSACGSGGLKGVDISPNPLNDPNHPKHTALGDTAYTGGVTIGLAGDEKVLYAVSLDAGVWKSENGAPWTQLANSPRYTYSIAVDPNEPGHLAVGERDGDFKDPTKNQSGIWESLDGGASFKNYFDPRSNGGCNRSQAIPSLVFTRANSVLVAATACGVAVRGNTGWQFPTTPLGSTLVTAVAASANKVWARDAAGTLIVSTDEGKTFALATNKPLPSDIQFNGAGDRFSLAAFDNFAVMSSTGDFNLCLDNSSARLVIYDAKNDLWKRQDRIYDSQEPDPAKRCLGSLDGTGGGGSGRRFLKAFELASLAAEFPSEQALVFGNGQELYMSSSAPLDPDKLEWTYVAGGGLGAPLPKSPSYQPGVHSDFWTAHVSASGMIWLGTDGGVFENRQDSQGWLVRNDGLHTQHVNGLFAAAPHAAFAYPTTDNAAWFAGFRNNWEHDDSGDSNWVVGDSGGSPPFAYAARNHERSAAIGFDNNVPDQEIPNAGNIVQGVQRAADRSQDGPLTFNVIQTLYTEPKPKGPTLDAVMLVKMPLQYYENDDRKKPLVTLFPNQGEPLAIVRNKQWLQHPSIGIAKGKGWEMMVDKVPSDTMGFMVAGGHQKPQLYALSNAKGTIDLWRWNGNTKANWKKLDIAGGGQPSGLLLGMNVGGEVGSFKGPVFVNPYRPNVLYALTSSGVRVSIDSGDTWKDETALTNAITGNGAYPLIGNFVDNFANLNARGHGPFWSMGTLCDMSFDLIYPDRVAAASPFTGVFYNKGDGTWHDLGTALPKPYTPVTSIFLFGNSVDVGLQGRGLWQIQGLDTF